MFSDGLNKKFLGEVSIPRTSRTHITRKCSANAGTNFLKRNLNLYELVEPPLNQSVKYPFRCIYLGFLAILLQTLYTIGFHWERSKIPKYFFVCVPTRGRLTLRDGIFG